MQPGRGSAPLSAFAMMQVRPRGLALLPTLVPHPPLSAPAPMGADAGDAAYKFKLTNELQSLNDDKKRLENEIQEVNLKRKETQDEVNMLERYYF